MTNWQKSKSLNYAIINYVITQIIMTVEDILSNLWNGRWNGRWNVYKKVEIVTKLN